MPYLRCDCCGLSEFSAALYSGRDTCSRCGSLLPVDASRARRLELLSSTARELRVARAGGSERAVALERRFDHLARSLAGTEA